MLLYEIGCAINRSITHGSAERTSTIGMFSNDAILEAVLRRFMRAQRFPTIRVRIGTHVLTPFCFQLINSPIFLKEIAPCLPAPWQLSLALLAARVEFGGSDVAFGARYGEFTSGTSHGLYCHGLCSKRSPF